MFQIEKSLGIKYHLLSSSKLFVLRLYIFGDYPIGLNQIQQLSAQKPSSSLHSSVCYCFAVSLWSASGFFDSSSYSEPEWLICPRMQNIYPAGWNFDVHKENWFPDQGSWVLRSSLGPWRLWTSCLETSFAEHSAVCAQVLPSPLCRVSRTLFWLSLALVHPLWTDQESSFGLITYT